MKIAGIAIGLLLCAPPAWATPITVTFSGTLAAQSIWNQVMPGFVTGAEIYGSISGDTELNGVGGPLPPAFLTLTVAGFSGSGYHGGHGPTFIQPTGVQSNGIGWCFTGFCSNDPVWISPFTFDINLYLQTQTGFIFYEGFISSVLGGPYTWVATINKVAVNVPEPSTLWLLAIGAAGIATRRIRKAAGPGRS